MKKLLMLLAAAMLTCVAQAAYVDWSAGSLSAYKNQAYYLFDAAKSADVLSALAAVDETTATTLSGMALKSGNVSSKGKITADGVNIGSATSIFALVLEGEIGDGVGYKTITENVSALAYNPPATSPGSFASQLSASGTTGTMSAAGGGGDVPEPTSGLLLLVGGAMLALRRKQK